MEPVEFFGIIFRSADHMAWFITTMSVLAISFALFIVFMREKMYLGPVVVWGLLGSLSSLTSLGAISKTKWGTINGPVWSADCIWYNGTLAGIYFFGATLCLLVWLVSRWHAKRAVAH